MKEHNDFTRWMNMDTVTKRNVQFKLNNSKCQGADEFVSVIQLLSYRVLGKNIQTSLEMKTKFILKITSNQRVIKSR